MRFGMSSKRGHGDGRLMGGARRTRLGAGSHRACRFEALEQRALLSVGSGGVEEAAPAAPSEGADSQLFEPNEQDIHLPHFGQSRRTTHQRMASIRLRPPAIRTSFRVRWS